MNFYDTNGRLHKMEIRASKYPLKGDGEGRGKYQTQVGKLIQSMFPMYNVLEEFPCAGEGLYLDFYIPLKGIAIEVHGDQHFKFNKFFHEDKNAFMRQKANDARKLKWCEINDIALVTIRWGTPEEEVVKILSCL